MRCSEALRAARKSAGLTQQKLAAASGVPQSAIARIERDRVVPRVDTLDRLLDACGWSLTSEPKPGFGVDRTLIRQMLALTPDERVRHGVTAARNVRALVDEMRGRR